MFLTFRFPFQLIPLILLVYSDLDPKARSEVIGNLVAVPKVRKFERNRALEFEFVSVSSRIEGSFDSIPQKLSFSWDMNQPDFLFGDACDVQLDLEVIDFEQMPSDPTIRLCLFRENSTFISSVFMPGSKLEILGSNFEPISFFEKHKPLTGFVMGEFNSLVQGFVVKGNFYGSVRIFDPLPHHHVVFYVEPIKSLVAYNSELVNYKKGAGTNAFVYEYVRHESDAAQDSNAKTPTFESKMDENMASLSHDISWRVKIKNGTSPTNLFDLRKNDFTVCEVCVWVQPYFAEMFGHGAGVQMGVAALQRLLAFVQFIFQSIDFNGDNSPDNIQILLKSLLVTDKIQIDASANQSGASNHSTQGNSPTATQTASAQAQTTPISNSTAAGPQQVGNVRKRSISDEAVGVESEEANSEEAKKETFTNETVTINPGDAYENLRSQLAKRFASKNCCAILAYVYHNLAPKLSYSTLGGICSRSHAVGIVSGFIHAHKVAEFDIFRSTMHVLGHLFGAKEDDIADPRCKVDVMETPNIFNPTVMDPSHKIDLGMRPNSMRYSPCAKLDITAFLTTPNVACLRGGSKVIARCGNGKVILVSSGVKGIVDPGEECDCGLPWQCHSDEMEKPSCCGESDTILGCRKIGSSRYQSDAHCHRPFVW